MLKFQQTTQQKINAELFSIFSLAESFFKKLFLKKQFSCFLVIGPEKSGKTSLLEAANLELLDLPIHHKLNKEINLPHFWYNSEAVFIEYSARNSDEKVSAFLLKHSLTLLNQNKNTFKLNGVLLVYSTYELASHLSAPQFKKLDKQLHVIDKYLKTKIPFYLILSQADTLRGFKEFFNDISLAERMQEWGVTLPLFSSHKSTIKQMVEKHFNTLINKLYDQVLWRMQREKNCDRQTLIKNFPLQVESLRYPLHKLISLLTKQFPRLKKLMPRGFYFTSSLQTNREIDRLFMPIKQAFDIQTYSPCHSSSDTRSYFIKSLLNEIIIQDGVYLTDFHLQHAKKYWLSITALLSALLILASSFYWISGFKQHVYQYNSATEALIEYRLMTAYPSKVDRRSVVNMLTRLNALQMAAENISTRHWFDIGNKRQKQLKLLATQIYQQALEEELFPYLVNALETELTNSQELPDDELYTTLKNYLMLKDSSALDPDSFLAWFRQYFRESTFNKDQRTHLLRHIQQAISRNFQPRSLDKALLAKSKERLNRLDLAQRSLVVLHHQFSTCSVTVLNSPFLQQAALILGIYKRENLHAVIHYIPQAISEVRSGNEIFSPIHLHYSRKQIGTLTERVKQLYIQQYIAAWESTLTTLKLKEINDLNDLVKILEQVGNLKAELNCLLRQGVENIKPVLRITAHASESSIYQPLQNYLTSNQRVQERLTALERYMLDIKYSKQPQQHFLNITKQVMEQKQLPKAISNVKELSKDLPEPIQHWMDDLAAASWQIILNNASNFINQSWQSDVMNFFNFKLKNRYPLDTTQTQDITLKDFNLFFSPRGILDQFYLNYLKGFVTISNDQWQWSTFANKSLKLDEKILHQLKYAAVIQAIFYNPGSTQAEIKFSLKPIALGTYTSMFSLVEGRNYYEYHPSSARGYQVTWPKSDVSAVILKLIDFNGEVITEQFSGPWAWLRIIEKFTVDRTENSLHYFLTFNIKGHTAQYEMTADNKLNPFIPNILSRFQPPLNLLKLEQ